MSTEKTTTTVATNQAQEIINKLTSESKFQDFKQMFKSDKEFDKFVRSFRLLTATNPDVLNATQNSLFMSLYKAGHDGLIVDGVKATITIFKTKDGGKQAVYMPMVKGIREKVYEFTGLLIDAQVVYANDTFEWEQGDSPKLKHIPTLLGELGKPVAVYAIARKGNDVIDRTVLRIAEVDKIKAIAKTDTIWKAWWEEMAKKTAVRRLAKQLPLPEEAENIVNADNILYDLDGETSNTPNQITHQSANDLTSAFKPATPKQAAAANVVNNVDQSTGEILKDESPKSTATTHSAEDYNVITDIINLVSQAKGKKLLNEEQLSSYEDAISNNFTDFDTENLTSTKEHLVKLLNPS